MEYEADALVSLKEASRIFNIRYNTIVELAADGTIPTHLLPGSKRRKVIVGEIRQFIKEH